MGEVNPLKGHDRPMGGIPDRWIAVTPHATNYIEGDSSNYGVAIALKSADGGAIQFIDSYGNTVTMTFAAGEILPGTFIRVLAAGTASTEIWAGMVGKVVS